MSLSIEVPEEIARAARALAETRGTTPEELLIDALKNDFQPVPPELQEEFDAWERASDEDMAKLDRDEDLGWR